MSQELKDSKTTLEKKNQTLEDEKNDLQKRLTTSLDAVSMFNALTIRGQKGVANCAEEMRNEEKSRGKWSCRKGTIQIFCTSFRT